MDKQQTISDLTKIYNALIAAQETVAAHHIARSVASLGGSVFNNAPADANQPGSE